MDLIKSVTWCEAGLYYTLPVQGTGSVFTKKVHKLWEDSIDERTAKNNLDDVNMGKITKKTAHIQH